MAATTALGTDCDTASAHGMFGRRVRGGLYGEVPGVYDLDGGNLRCAADFRSLHRTALERWWALVGVRARNRGFRGLDLLRA